MFDHVDGAVQVILFCVVLYLQLTKTDVLLRVIGIISISNVINFNLETFVYNHAKLIEANLSCS